MTDATPTETELKIPVGDLADIRSRLAMRDATRTHPPERETNILLDTEQAELGREGRVLRLRSIGGRRRLTLKGPATFEGTIKSREELEVEVGDVDTVAAILLRLGYSPVFRYEKDREEWDDERVTISLDHTPMGDFVELEGDAERLPEAARCLGLDPGDAVHGSYPSLWREHRDRHPELALPRDMVFSE